METIVTGIFVIRHAVKKNKNNFIALYFFLV